MTHVAILGAGLGGVPMALEARKELRKEDKVTVISDSATFHFTPSNPWVAVDWRKPDAIKVDLAPMFAKKKIDFIHSAAKKVQPEQNNILLANGETVDYDYLVIATGPELAFDEIEGLGPHGGHTQSICHVDHAADSKLVWDDFVKDPGPIVVGAVQGASCFGPAYEFAMIMETDLRKRKIRDKVPMTFVTSEPYIGHLGLDGVGDTKGLLESEMRNRHIKWITSARVTKVEPARCMSRKSPRTALSRPTHELPFKYSMMLPPFRGIEAVRGIEGLVNPRGFVIADETPAKPQVQECIFCWRLRCHSADRNLRGYPLGVPKTGFMIESMVHAAAKNIRALIDGKEPRNEATWNAVCIADFGDGGVTFVAMPQIPPRNVNWSADGGWVHLAKVAFEKYFLGKIRRGVGEPFYEKAVFDMLGVHKVKPKAD